MKKSTKKMLSLLMVFCILTIYVSPSVINVTAVGTPVCEINSVGYNTLSDALTAVNTNDTIKLLSNINYNSGISISNMNITFDLNGFTLNVINPNDTGSNLDQCGLYIFGTSVISIIGTGELNVQGNRYGVYSTCLTAGDANVTVTNASSPAGTGVYSDKATVTVKNDINSGYEGVFANTEANITIEGDVITNGNNSSGLNMISSSIFTIYGDIIVTGDQMEGIRGNDGCNITVHGNVDCTGIGTVGVSGSNSTININGNVRAHMTGVKARSYSNITVNGDVTSYGTSDDSLFGGIRNAVYAYAGSAVTVYGNLYSENIGVYITDEWGARVSSTVTVNGFIQAAARANRSYIYFATDDIGMIFEDGLLDDPVMAGHRKYSNASGVVYVSKFGGGTGTTTDPYMINHSHQLYNVRENLVDNFKLGNDIDMAYFMPDNGWLPIGRETRQYSGIFDGNNKTINNLKIQRETLAVTPRYLGIFAYTSSTAVIKNLSLTNVDIRGWDNIGSVVGYSNGHVLNVNSNVTLNCVDDLGGLVGYNKGTIENSYATGTLTNGTYYAGGIAGHNDGTIRNSYFRGTVNGDEYNGGLVGWNNGSVYDSYAEITVNGGWWTGGLVGYNQGLLKNSYSTGSVITDGDYVGGLVGINTIYTRGPVYLGVIDSCYSSCSVQGDYYIGGLAGYNDGEIKLSYALGNSTGEYDIGGLVGAHYDSPYALIENSYSRGNVTGRGSVGGLAGLNEKTIQNCYSTGTVSKVGTYGGLVGDDLAARGVVNASYWDTQTSDVSTSYGGEGKTTALMKITSTYSTWDFTTIWGINGLDNDGYPYLRWQGFSVVLPVVSAVTLSRVTRNTATLSFNSDTVGTYYYLVYAATDSAPNSAIVKAQGIAVAKGTNVAVAAQNTAEIAGLSEGTAYKVYVVVENAAGTLSNVSEASFSTLPPNTIPNRKVSVTGTYSETVTVNNPFSLNLNYIFEDADLDPLTYTVSIAGAAKIAAAANYTYTPAIAGDTVLVFKANDGTAESTDTYTVTVTAVTPTYALTITAGTGGNIVTGTNGNFTEGTVITLSAVASAGYTFTGWSSSASGAFGDFSLLSTTFTMPGNAVSIFADFAAIPPVLSSQSASNVTLTSATLNYTSNMAGTAYYLIQRAESPAVDASALRALGVATSALATTNQIVGTGLSPSTSYKAYIMVRGNTGADSAISVISFRTLTPLNTVPNRAQSVAATYAETVAVNTAFTLNLESIFEDADGDVLTYTVSVEGAAATAASSTYSYTPITTGNTILVFKANDGECDSSDTYTVTVTATDAPPPVTLYQFNISADTGGIITSGFNDNMSGETRLGISAVADTDYEFLRWESNRGGEFIDALSAMTTFVMPYNDVSITAKFKYVGQPDEGHETGYSADIIGATETTRPVLVDGSGYAAKVDTSDNIFNNDDNTIISVPKIPNVLSYSLSLPAQNLSNHASGKSVIFNSPIATIELPDDMLSNLHNTKDKKAVITVRKADNDELSDEILKIAGDRPLVQLSLMLDGQEIEWKNPEVPVQVTIPYSPTSDELLNSDAITVWALNDSGDLTCIKNGIYDPDFGTVTFKTRYFKYFAIGYNEQNLNGKYNNAWYANAMEFAAAREILTKMNGSYGPFDELTRSDFIVMMLEAYNVIFDSEYTDNFKDAENQSTMKYLAAAKKLGVSNGIGDNMFNPSGKVTRQEMFTMLYRLLNALNELPTDVSENRLVDFLDSTAVADWAKEAIELLIKAGVINGNNNYLYPLDTATKAEFAQLLYNLIKK